jgi:hypothetical protein
MMSKITAAAFLIHTIHGPGLGNFSERSRENAHDQQNRAHPQRKHE